MKLTISKLKQIIKETIEPQFSHSFNYGFTDSLKSCMDLTQDTHFGADPESKDSQPDMYDVYVDDLIHDVGFDRKDPRVQRLVDKIEQAAHEYWYFTRGRQLKWDPAAEPEHERMYEKLSNEIEEDLKKIMNVLSSELEALTK